MAANQRLSDKEIEDKSSLTRNEPTLESSSEVALQGAIVTSKESPDEIENSSFKGSTSQSSSAVGIEIHTKSVGRPKSQSSSEFDIEVASVEVVELSE